MTSIKREMKLGAFVQDVGHHIAAWRHPEVPADGAFDLDYYRCVAQIAERGKFDMVFFGDTLGFQYPEDEDIGRTSRVLRPEPVTLLAALSTATRDIGLIATLSTSYIEPFHVARKFATLDHLSGGRCGWNIVTSTIASEARNLGREDLMDHHERYQRAFEFVKVVTGLWDTWQDDAFVRNKSTGQFFDVDKLHVLNHQGEYFSSRGPLNAPRPPQGHPVLIQAGSSEDGRAFASQVAEVIFTASQTLVEAQAFYTDIKSRTERNGRSVDDVKVMPGIMPVVGRTEEEAQEKFDRLQKLIHPSIGWTLLGRHLGGVDLSGYPIDGPLPELPPTQGNQSRQKLLVDMARREGLSIRQLYERVVGTRGHWLVIGTASQIADQLQARFENGAADGFNVMAPWLPGGLEEFVNDVVPELQRRGLFRTEYTGRTLREHLGLARPHHPSLSKHAEPRTETVES